MMMTLLLVSVLVIAGISIVFLQRNAMHEKEHLRQDLTEKLEAERRLHEQEKEDLDQEIRDLRDEKIRLEVKLKSTEEAAKTREDYQKEFDKRQAEYIESLKNSFKVLSAENSDLFKVRSAETIAEIMKPVQEKFESFSKAVKESQDASLERHSKLEQKIDDLDKSSRRVGEDARSLADAITGHAKFQGNFGEMLLVDILKSAGLQEGIHFSTQSVMTDQEGYEIKSTEGKKMIPDVLVYYPDDTVVVVDSKVSLTAYVKYTQAESVEDRLRYGKEHVESVRNHINELKVKDYASYLPEGKRKVEYNIMFVPVEDAFRLMLDEEPLLWQQAKDANVLVVSQMTLVIVLNMISMSWKQFEQEKNISDVYKVAEELMSQIKGWLEEYVKIGQHLEKASDAYDKSLKKLSTSNQSVVKKIEKLESLGLGPRRSNAKIRTGERMTGPSSVIPQVLKTSGEKEEENIFDKQ